MAFSTILQEDCLPRLKQCLAGSIDCCITSPPYNLKVDYGSYKDNRSRNEYLKWMDEFFDVLSRILKPEGHFFLNIGGAASDPELSLELMENAKFYFKIQNHVIWIKSIAMEGAVRGHCKPVQSQRFLNRQWENVFHLTLDGHRPIDRLAIGVPYADKSNLRRGSRGKNGDIRCAGDVWFIPYPTVHSKKLHPAAFPEELVRRCLKMARLPIDALVLDPFAGSGTVGAVALQMDYNSLLFEINEEYVQMYKERAGIA